MTTSSYISGSSHTLRATQSVSICGTTNPICIVVPLSSQGGPAWLHAPTVGLLVAEAGASEHAEVGNVGQRHVVVVSHHPLVVVASPSHWCETSLCSHVAAAHSRLVLELQLRQLHAEGRPLLAGEAVRALHSPAA